MTEHKKAIKRNLLLTIPLIVFVLLSALASFWYVHAIREQAGVVTPKSKVAEYTYNKYYVAVTGHTNQLENISFEELKAKDVLVTSADSNSISCLLKKTESANRPDVVTDPISEVIKDKSKIAILPFDKVDYRVKTLSIGGKNLWDKSMVDYPLKITVSTQNKAELDSRFDPQKVTLLTNVGDVILGRTVAKKMAISGDPTHPWLKMAGLLKKSDITFANLETPLSDRVAPPYEGMSFIAPSSSIDGLKLAGIDVVSLANNHSTNFGTNTFLDTLSNLENAGIEYVGGGKDAEEAYRTLYYEKNGLKFAFLDYNSIIGAINATDSTPGIAKFDIKPWASMDNQNDIEKIKSAVHSAKEKADVVIVELHWGVEYTPNPIPSQISVAHQVAEAGATVVIGTHPHVVAGLESYKGVPIFYSLGNFIFDQEWSTETKQGTLAQTYFYNNKLVSMKLIPYQIEDYNQPQIPTVKIGTEILNRIFKASLSPEFKL